MIYAKLQQREISLECRILLHFLHSLSIIDCQYTPHTISKLNHSHPEHDFIIEMKGVYRKEKVWAFWFVYAELPSFCTLILYSKGKLLYLHADHIQKAAIREWVLKDARPKLSTQNPSNCIIDSPEGYLPHQN